MDISSLASSLQGLQQNYLIANGLMLNPENKRVLESLLKTLNINFDSLMTQCVLLSDDDLIPGTSVKKVSVELDKAEFDARVQEWFSKVHSGLKVPVNTDGERSDRLSVSSAKSERSTTSSRISYKRKEGRVKLQLARYARELHDEKCKQEEMELKMAEEAARKAKEADLEIIRVNDLIARKKAKRRIEENIRLAEVEVRAWDEEPAAIHNETSQPSIPSQEVQREPLKTGEKEGVIGDMARIDKSPQRIVQRLSAPSVPTVQDYPPPRPEIKSFDGNPLSYWTFVRSFEVHIASKLLSDAAKLVYLLQHCVPNVRQNLEHFSSDTVNGYKLAWESLYNEFGQPHIVAHCCEQKLLSFPRLKAKEPQAIKNLSVLFENSLGVLGEIQEFATLNSLGTIQRLLEKLPDEMRKEWVKYSFSFQKQSKRHAGFPELVLFVREQSDETNSLYGRALYGASKSFTGCNLTKKKSVVLNTTVSSEKEFVDIHTACPFCKKGSHSLAKCNGFLSLGRYKRIRFLMSERRCFLCLEPGHYLENCESGLQCTVASCKDKRHHTLLHKDKDDEQREHKVVCAATTKHAVSNRKKPFFMTVPVKIRHNNVEVTTYALLDSGSQSTFCTKGLARKLKAKGPAKVIPISTLSSKSQPLKINCEEIAFSVVGMHSEETVFFKNVLIDKIPLKAPQIPDREQLDSFEHLRSISFDELEDKTIDLLVGLDVPSVFRPLDVRFGSEGTPDAIKTRFGWMLFGPALSSSHESPNDSVSTVAFVNHCSLADELALEFPPHRYTAECGIISDSSREDRVALDILNESVEFVDGHFQLPLLWRHKNTRLPNNRLVAVKRLNSLKKRLDRDCSLSTRYCEVMQDYILQGFAEKVETEYVEEGCSWFLPHHPVVNPHKPEKLRIVFDCAAKFMDSSLNDALMRGPDLLNNLVGVLTRFRLYPIAMVSDIEKMFHQVKVKASDRNFLRFLWWPEGNTSQEPEVYRMTVHLFGATSSPCCATFCLRQVSILRSENCSEEAKNAINRSFYVDDCLVSTETVEQAIALASEMQNVLSSCGFNLTKWSSNSAEVLSSIPEEKRSDAGKGLSLDNKKEECVLGIHWDVQSDNLRVKINLTEKPCTRRGILSMSHSLFDPLGIVAPVLLEVKLLLREIKDREWDEELSESECERWKDWLCSLNCLHSLNLPRCLKPPSFVGNIIYELHHFADASQVAYGAVTYLRIISEDSKIHCSFMIGKSHLAPQPTTTIPRLELLAAVTSVRLDRTLKKESMLPGVKSYFWSDSTAVLQSIYNCRRRFPVFVANRLAEIERHSETKDWRYVPSKLNPADEVTRGLSASALANSKWIKGPKFLLESSSQWPEQLEGYNAVQESFLTNEKPLDLVSTMLAWREKDESLTPTDQFVRSFSSLHRLKRATVWLKRFFKYLLLKKENNVKLEQFGKIKVSEMKSAESCLVKYCQRQTFSALIRRIESGGKIPSRLCPKSLKRLNPCVLDGVLRVGGRIKNAQVEFESRHPAILPSKSHFTRLVVQHYHELVGHSGIQHTCTAVKKRYFIHNFSAAIRCVLDLCSTCKRQTSRFEKQVMADLPQARLQIGQPPFFHTGVDCFGPFLVKQGRARIKRYGCLFCCMTTRAIHIEVLHSLSCDSFISALRRFIARRGAVAHLYSDNGTNFVSADKALRKAVHQWNQQQIASCLLQKEIDWHFNTPLASHFGGAWERLIRSVRKVCGSLTHQVTFTDEALNTFFVEIENIINSRPLTPVSFVESADRPLTPNDLLMISPTCGLPPVKSVESDSLHANRWRCVQYAVDLFWKRWVREYLPSLNCRQKWQSVRKNVCVNDIVLLVNQVTPRAQWPLARVIETFPDVTGFVRSVKVKTSTGEYNRPISKLCVLVPASPALSL